MPRPIEYENLIKNRSLEAVNSTPGATTAYLKSAADYLSHARQGLDSVQPGPVFTSAYEGFFLVVQAVLEFHQVRTREAGRNLAIQRVCADLQLIPSEFRLVSNAHERRNATTYRSPFPPISRAEAAAMIGILEKYLPVASALTRSA